jgi:gliding motility-associated-like protein
VGPFGVMIKSTDGGINWTQLPTPLTPFNKNVNGLHFINKDTGYIGGQSITSGNTTNINDAPKVYFTRNGGATWDSLVTPFRPAQNTPTLSGFNTTEIQRIYFVNDSVGYICGSANASTNLSAILWKFEKGVLKDYSLHRTKFGISATTGTAANHGPSTQTYKGLIAVNDSLVLISSNSNGIVVRVRTGKNDSTANAVPAIYGAYERGKYEIVVWIGGTATPFPTNAGLISSAMWQLKKAPNGNIIMTNGSRIAFSSDNGTTWASTQATPSTLNYAHWSFFAMDVTPNGRIIVSGHNGITYDSLPGSPWRTQYKNTKPLFYNFNDVDWADCNNGVVVGASGTIQKTSDGGKTWVDNSNPIFDAASMNLYNVIYPSVTNMFCLGGGTVWQSPDQGTNLNALFTEPQTNSTMNSMAMVGQDRAFVVSFRFSPAVQRAYIFRTLNASSPSPVWDTVKTFPVGNNAPQFRNIKFANQDTGYVCGTRGKVYRTIDGGVTWSDISPDTLVNGNGAANYPALAVVNGKTLYVGGSSRKLFKSTDAGLTWTDLTLVVPVGPPTTINSVATVGYIVMNDANNGYAQAGAYLLKTADGWVTWTYDIAPLGIYSLSLYPKIAGPIDSKKLYVTNVVAGFPGANSVATASLVEYGNVTTVNVSTSDVIANATCTNTTGGSITLNTTGGIPPYMYSINGGPFQTSNVFSSLSQGPKTILIKDAGCQLISKTITVGFTDNLTLTTNNDTTVCAGAPVQLIATSAATSYAWTPAGGLSNAAISNPIATVNTAASYTVTATLNGCVKTKTVNVSIKPNPVVNAGPDKTIYIGDAVTLQGGGATNPLTIAWTPNATLTGANTYTPVAMPGVTTTYTLTVKDNNSCTATDNMVVTVIPDCMKVANAFTPNGDGINELWTVTNNGGNCVSQVKVKVYNRYGGLVYQNDNYQNNWDGKYNGKPVTDGTYYYVVTYTVINGNPLTVKGDVTILR